MTGMPPSARRNDGGLSLIESLVSLAIFGVAAVTLMSAIQSNLQTLSAVQQRLVVQWTLENAAAELIITGSAQTDPPAMLGQQMTVAARNTALLGTGLQQVSLSVDADGATLDLVIPDPGQAAP